MRVVLIAIVLFLAACHSPIATDKLDADIALLDQQISKAQADVDQYGNSLIGVTAALRLQAMKQTRAMLDQKRTGYHRFVEIRYTVDGKAYLPPADKDRVLGEIQQELDQADANIAEASADAARFSGGLLGAVAKMKVASLQNTRVFLDQRRLLLKYDIPAYNYLKGSVNERSDFVPTPGKDSDKL